MLDVIVGIKIRDFKFVDFLKYVCCFDWEILFVNIVFWYDKCMVDDMILIEKLFFC